MELLLEHNADPNLQNKDGITALHLASLAGKKYIVERLLKHNGDPNLQTKNGETSLHWVSIIDKKEIVELLLEHNADPNLQNYNGNTALHLASQSNTEIIKLLQEAQITYPIKKAHEQSVFIEKVIFMEKYVNIKIKLVNNGMYNYICL